MKMRLFTGVLSATAVTAGAVMLVSTRPEPRGSSEISVVAGPAEGSRANFAGGSDGPAQLQAAAAWRSSLYPSGWLPIGAGGSATADGKFLNDFSYAGYLTGDTPVPTTVGANITRSVSASTYGNGSSDATSGIQAAIDQVCAGGGGTVNLGAGTFRIKPQGSASFALHIKCRDLIMRGAKDAAGAPTTFLFNDEASMRQKRVIVMGESSTGVAATLYDTAGNIADAKVSITQDLLRPTRVIPVASTTGYQVDDYVIVTFDWSDAFRAEHNMSSYWPADQARGMLFYRKITAINATAKTLTVDIPLRYPVKIRDRARVYKPRAFFANLGLENIAIGMRENNVASVGDDDYDRSGTGAYQMHQATAVQIVLARHSWVRNVRSYRPSVNARDVHLLSNGVHVTTSTRSILLDNVQMSRPQYLGAGGNGYLLYLNGGEALVRNSTASNGRHNFVWTGPSATGNVLLATTSNNARYEDDFHQYLSPSNLVDGHMLNNVALKATNRQDISNGAGYTSSQSVFWNTRVNANSTGNFIQSDQFGWGYVIGTQGRSSGVFAPNEHVEGLGIGDGLQPSSLYLDQKAKRDASSAY